MLRWMSFTLEDQILDKALDLLQDLIPRIPSKVFYRYHGVRILLGTPLCSPNWLITEKILHILIKLSQKDEDLFKTIIMKDGNHQQLLNVLHRAKKGRSSHSDLIKNIQTLLGIIEKPKPKKIVSPDLKDLMKYAAKKREEVLEHKSYMVEEEPPLPNDTDEQGRKPIINKRNSWNVARTFVTVLPKFTAIKNKIRSDTTDSVQTSADPSVSRKNSLYKKTNNDSRDNIVSIPRLLP